jgi:hypothetical protein
MIEQPGRVKKTVASPRPISQLSVMRANWFVLGTLSLVLVGCGLPAPYQTYAPGTGSAPPATPSMPVMVYGATTTTPDMVPDTTDFGSTGPGSTGQDTPAATPFIPATTPTPGANVVAICYARLWNKPDVVRDAATLACGTGTTPSLTSQKVDIEACPLLTPTKAVFACGTGGTH